VPPGGPFRTLGGDGPTVLIPVILVDRLVKSEAFPSLRAVRLTLHAAQITRVAE
jgi:hypothetical protein